MYKDSKVIYREYIQNACDQIDKAYDRGLLRPSNPDSLGNLGSGRIDIWLDTDKRTISIEDNATGICAADFEKTLADIANSDKKLGEDKGFRGIGRLCGLAYCKELVFTSTAEGENIISIMRCDAIKMRELITASEDGKKYTASEVLSSIYKFDSKNTGDKESHWFKVEMIGINDENTDLLDFTQIKEYLSFVAPVPYQNTFLFRAEVYKHAKEIGCNIDEYNIFLNGEQIFKKYKTIFKTSKGEDEVFNLAFKEIYDSHNHLLAWLWIGVSHFKAIISKECKMRGLRLRKENIQIGREERGLLYAETATYDEICTFDETIRPLYDKLFHKSKRVRYIDFNQGLDARLATDKRMKKLSEINIRPLRIAFDHYEQSEVYISAVKKAAKYGIMELSNYLLYNFEDEPKELYYRMRINVDLCEELGVTIYSFPMKYHPINDPEYFKNRDYLGKHWNRKFIRAVQAVLNSTKGKIGKGIEFFEEAFGRDLDEFYKILWMPETFIIYRRKYDKKLRERLADRYKNHSSEDCDLANEWWTKFCSLPAEKLEIAKSIISLNKFKEGDYDCTDKEILDVLSYYSITRDIAEQSI